MANYKETSASGVTWVRCNTVVVQNDYEEAPYVVFSEESVVNLDGVVFKRSTGACRTDFDPAATISLVDPATNLPTGETITHADVYRILHSAYIQAAMARDAEDGA